MWRRLRFAMLAVLLLALAAISYTVLHSGRGSAGSVMVGPKPFYLALGDSIAYGTQPGGPRAPSYADDIAAALAPDGTSQLIDMGCPSETSTTFLNGGCPFQSLVRYPYTGPQLAAAVNFLTQHPGQVSPVTLDIGYNDQAHDGLYSLTPCALASPAAIARSLATFDANLHTILAQLQAALAGSGDLLVMTNYTAHGGECAATATLQHLFNDHLSADVAAAGATLVPVYDRFDTGSQESQTLCAYTWICSSYHDIHPTSQGHAAIAAQFLASAGYPTPATFTATPTATGAPTALPTNTPLATVTPLGPDSGAYAGTLAAPGASDSYTITPQASGAALIESCAVAAGNTLALAVYTTGTNALLAGGTAGACSEVRVQVSADQSYTVTNTAGAGAGDYRSAWSVNGQAVSWYLQGTVPSSADQTIPFPALQPAPVSLIACGPAGTSVAPVDALGTPQAGPTAAAGCQTSSFQPATAGLYGVEAMAACAGGAWSGIVTSDGPTYTPTATASGGGPATLTPTASATPEAGPATPCGTATATPTSTAVSGSGSLAGSSAAAPSAVDLTGEGTMDWAHWGLLSADSLDHKATVTQQIGTYSLAAAGVPQRYTQALTSLSWSDGTPDAANPGTGTGVSITGIGNGFTIAAPADTTPRTLHVYVGVRAAQGQFTAHLSDGSAADFSDSTLDNQSGVTVQEYTLAYTAASAGQTLSVTYTMLANHGSGTISLLAATLAGSAAATSTPTQPPTSTASVTDTATNTPLPSNTATPAGPLSGSFTGRIAQAHGSVSYTIAPGASGAIALAACGISTANTVSLTLTDSSHTVLASTEAASCVWTSAQVQAEATYSLTIASAAGGGVLSSWSVADTPVIWRGSGTIAGAGSTQSYSIVTLTTAPISASLCGPLSTVFRLDLTGSGPAVLAGASAPANCQALTYTPAARGLYRLRVSAITGSGAWASSTTADGLLAAPSTTPTVSATPASATSTATASPTGTDTATATTTQTATATASVTDTAIATGTATSSATDSPSPTATDMASDGATQTPTDTATPTAFDTETATSTATTPPSPSATSSPRPTATATAAGLSGAGTGTLAAQGQSSTLTFTPQQAGSLTAGSCSVTSANTLSVSLYDRTNTLLASTASPAYCTTVSASVAAGQPVRLVTTAVRGSGAYSAAWSVNHAPVTWHTSGTLPASGATQSIAVVTLWPSQIGATMCGPVGTNFTLALTGPGPTVLAGGAAPGNCQTLGYSSPAAGMYRLRVTAVSGAGAWAARLTSS